MFQVWWIFSNFSLQDFWQCAGVILAGVSIVDIISAGLNLMFIRPHGLSLDLSILRHDTMIYHVWMKIHSQPSRELDHDTSGFGQGSSVTMIVAFQYAYRAVGASLYCLGFQASRDSETLTWGGFLAVKVKDQFFVYVGFLNASFSGAFC